MKNIATKDDVLKQVNILLNGETIDHLERVSKLTHMLISIHNYRLRLGLSEEYMMSVVKVSSLHDIGKARIPSDILDKPGKLTDMERTIIEKHPEHGIDVLKELESTMTMFSSQDEREIAEEVIRYHHERWNGTGYPCQLKKDEIPLSARIVAVADVFDALISKRPYKRAWSVDEALHLLRYEKGQHFDPALVESFLLLRDVLIEQEQKQEQTA